mmetsp:Transcript_64853/g.200863  ORF Transcript_64853/g.200863 Transcript_64853/m.200863 type:complete len:252 (+) Transcript_64853:359-1114(+)
MRPRRAGRGGPLLLQRLEARGRALRGAARDPRPQRRRGRGCARWWQHAPGLGGRRPGLSAVAELPGHLGLRAKVSAPQRERGRPGRAASCEPRPFQGRRVRAQRLARRLHGLQRGRKNGHPGGDSQGEVLQAHGQRRRRGLPPRLHAAALPRDPSDQGLKGLLAVQAAADLHHLLGGRPLLPLSNIQGLCGPSRAQHEVQPCRPHISSRRARVVLRRLLALAEGHADGSVAAARQGLVAVAAGAVSLWSLA